MRITGWPSWATLHAGLPDDLLNFQDDLVAYAVAAGLNGAVVEEQRLWPVMEGDVLRFRPDQGWTARAGGC